MILIIISTLSVLSVQRAIKSSRPSRIRSKIANVLSSSKGLEKEPYAVEMLFGSGGCARPYDMVPTAQVCDKPLNVSHRYMKAMERIFLSNQLYRKSLDIPARELADMVYQVALTLKKHGFSSKHNYIIVTQKDKNSIAGEVLFQLELGNMPLYVIPVTDSISVQEESLCTYGELKETQAKNTYQAGKAVLQQFSRYPSSLPEIFLKDTLLYKKSGEIDEDHIMDLKRLEMERVKQLLKSEKKKRLAHGTGNIYH